MYYLKIVYSLTFLCLLTCINSLAESDYVQDGRSKLAKQNELKANEDVKTIETGTILLIDYVKWEISVKTRMAKFWVVIIESCVTLDEFYFSNCRFCKIDKIF